MKSKINKVEYRREMVFKLMAQGQTNQFAIASQLQISQPTISNDMKWIREQATSNLRHHIDKKIPEDYMLVNKGINEVLLMAWEMTRDDDKRIRLAAMSIIRDSYAFKCDLMTNSAVLQQAMAFVDRNKQELIKTQIEQKLDQALAEDKQKNKKATSIKPTKQTKKQQAREKTVF